MWFLTATTFMGILYTVLGHGRLMDPPARNSMWRLGFSNPVNYNDNELYCGGRVTQWARNNGKCGVCGDPHHHTKRDHEVGGKYANGIISREYVQGGVISVTVHITANHKGYFEFRICPVEDPKIEVTQECLDQHLIKVANEAGSRYFLPEGKSNQFFNVTLELPEDVTCKQCVIQWKYRTGNTWDKDDSGKFCVGCGPQEEFYNCADVTIHPRNEEAKSQITKGGKQLNEKEQKMNKKTTRKEDIVFTNVKDNEDDLNRQTISEYGKQKVDLINKLGTEKYSLWGEPEIKSNLVSPFAHLARKDGVVSEGKMSSGLRFGFNGDRYSNEHTVPNSITEFTGPAGVAYQWKVGTPDNENLENIRRRFSYSSHKSSNDIKNDLPMKKLENQESSKSVISNRSHSMQGLQKEEKTKLSLFTDQRNMLKTQSFISRPITTPYGDSSSNTVTLTPVPSSLPEVKAVSKLHDSLKNILRNNKVKPQQQENFLRRWKLMRLKHIAALEAIRSANEQKTKSQALLPSSKPRTRVAKRFRSFHNRSNNLLISPSQLPYVTKELAQKTVLSSALNLPLSPTTYLLDPSVISSTAIPSYTKSPESKPQNSQQKYQKKRLPSWLVAALRLSQRKARKTDRFGTKEGHNDSGRGAVDRNSLPAVHGDGVLKQTNVRSHLNSNYHGLITLSPHKTDKNLNYITHRIQSSPAQKVVTSNKASRQNKDIKSLVKTRTHLNVSKTQTSSAKTNNVDTSNNMNEDNDLKDTESLVKYIVTLLLSQKENGGRNKHPRKADVTGDNTGDISPSKTGSNLPVINEHGSDSQVLQSSEKTINIKNSITNPNRRRVHYSSKQKNRQISRKYLVRNISSLPNYSEHKNDTKSSSARPDVLPYSGLILGSDLGYSREQTGDNVNSLPGWATAKPVIKKDIFSGQENSNDKNNNYVKQKQHVTTETSKQLHTNYKQEQQSQSKWLPRHVHSLSENSNDRHHLWTVRAAARKARYDTQQNSARPQLMCKSLVTLSGGMDRWCSDNCNANFCPPSICVCTAKDVPTSSYSSFDSSSNTHTGLQTRQRNGHFPSGMATEDLHSNHGSQLESNDADERHTIQREKGTIFHEYPAISNRRSIYEPPTHTPATKVHYSLTFSNGINKDNIHSSTDTHRNVNQDENTRIQSLNWKNNNMARSMNPLHMWYSNNMISQRPATLSVDHGNSVGNHLIDYH